MKKNILAILATMLMLGGYGQTNDTVSSRIYETLRYNLNQANFDCQIKTEIDSTGWDDTTKQRKIESKNDVYEVKSQFDTANKRKALFVTKLLKSDIIQPNSLDAFLYSSFGKVALDNDDFISSGSAFSAKFSNDDAQIAANYSQPFRQGSDHVWSVGLKAEATDGTYYLFKSNQLNFGVAAQIGITKFLGSNGIYYDTWTDTTWTVPTCQAVHDERSDTVHQLLTKYYAILCTDISALKKRVSDISESLNDQRLNDFSNMERSSNRAALVAERRLLMDTLRMWQEIMDSSYTAHGLYNTAMEDILSFEKGIIDRYSTGYHIHWVDMKLDLGGDNKHVLDISATSDDYTPLKSFIRASFSCSYNYYRITKKMLAYVKVGATAGNAFGYDLLTPDEVSLDTTLLTQNGKSLDKAGESFKVFNKYENPDYNANYFLLKAPLLTDIFFGPKKAYGIEINGSVGLMANTVTAKAPFDAQFGLLFSPLDKNTKTNDGTIGLMIGVKKGDLSAPEKLNVKDNLYIGIRVGLPITPALAKK